ncbi:hypothetical protein B296_00055072, partial [Ensete ventricosum]
TVAREHGWLRPARRGGARKGGRLQGVHKGLPPLGRAAIACAGAVTVTVRGGKRG